MYFRRKRLQWSRGSVLAFSTQVCGFKPGRSRRIFKGEKILTTPSFGGEVKPSVPCHRFTARKRTLKCNVEVDILGKITGLISRPQNFHLSLLGSLTSCRTWRHLAVKVGMVRTTKGKHNKPSGCSASEHMLRALIMKKKKKKKTS